MQLLMLLLMLLLVQDLVLVRGPMQQLLKSLQVYLSSLLSVWVWF